jgi:hypothetical protein
LERSFFTPISWSELVENGGKNGSKVGSDGQFNTCHSLVIDTRFGEPRLLVADRENRRLCHLDLEGNWIDVHATNLRRPCSMSFHGEFLAVAELEARVTILDKTGTPVAFLGDNPDRKQWAFRRETRRPAHRDLHSITTRDARSMASLQEGREQKHRQACLVEMQHLTRFMHC